MKRWGTRRRRLALLAVALPLCVLALANNPGGAPAAGVAPTVYVFPIPGGRVASPSTQITFRGVPAGQLGTIHVTGSQSGSHSGHVAPDSDGHGGSFILDNKLAPGETVTVTAPALNIEGTGSSTYTFNVANPAPPPGRWRWPGAGRVPGDVWRYQSYSSIAPQAVKIVKNSNRTAPGDIFLAAEFGPVQDGPEILDSNGNLIWFKAVSGGQFVTDFRVQKYRGNPVLTWWQGYIGRGTGQGQGVITDSSYNQIDTVSAGNGLNADLHEFQLTPWNTAMVTAYYPVYWNASRVGGSKHQVVFDSVVQEIDIPTGLVLFQWDSLDHVKLRDSYVKPPSGAGTPYDYFHANSIEPDHDGNLVLSSQRTFAAYKVDHNTAATIWILGGKRSSFKMGYGAQFAFQHDVRVRSAHDMYLTAFDDGAGPFKVHTQSRGVKLRLDFTHMTASMVTQYLHTPALLADYEGNTEQVGGFNVFVGWGHQPYFSEYDSGGHLLFDGRFVGQNPSYRVWKFPWVGTPHTQPRVHTRNSGNSTIIWMSWNGATQVASWRVLGGSSPSALQSVGSGRKSGFETVITVPAQTYVAVQALDSQGHVLSTSATTHT